MSDDTEEAANVSGLPAKMRDDEIEGVRRVRAALVLAQLDYRREIAALSQRGYDVADIARAVGVPGYKFAETVRVAQETAPIPEGFSGATVREICQRYFLGQITQEQVIHELTTWDYAIPEPRELGEFEEYEELPPSPPNSLNDVVQACQDGVLDGTTYETIIRAVMKRRQA
ncbi:hypothetical protein [Timonella sp. A28]|uniref:hypothetical protein n=1 Tax=Timonella sp. A28 TaxID=3442640 RepID=UPI003EBD9F6C